MNQRAIPTKRATVQPNDLVVGKPVPYDIEDAYGHLLLRRGSILRSREQLERLLQIGRTPYHVAAGREDTGGISRRRELALAAFRNPFDLIYQISRALQETFKWVGEDNERFLRRLDHLASRIGDLVERDADAAIGAAHLDEAFAYSIRHPIRQAVLCDVVGSQLGIPDSERRSIVLAALSANIGMLETQDRLAQQTTPLDANQRRDLEEHPIRSVERLSAAGVEDTTWIQVVAQHHERLDGSGYPNGLRKDQICRGARLLSLADTYLAMISNRVYRPATAVREALLELMDQSGEIYDRDILSGLIQTIGIYPAGSFVALDSGERGVVIHRGHRGANPVVAVLIKANGQPTARPLYRDTSQTDMPSVASLEPTHQLTQRFQLASLWGYDS
ncbi:HD-GYP domain-containing protein [Halorhodospira halophila]|nr:HD domain-containing phosphohydrolase [Halorhodospira halophila]